jgi:hypothetical protein
MRWPHQLADEQDEAVVQLSFTLVLATGLGRRRWWFEIDVLDLQKVAPCRIALLIAPGCPSRSRRGPEKEPLPWPTLSV